MTRFTTEPKLARESLTQGAALACLVLMAAIAIAGPSGILAWGENQRLLVQRQAKVEALKAERDDLRNRVNLLNPRNADPDLTGELLRSNLNVIHPDEMVILLDR